MQAWRRGVVLGIALLALLFASGVVVAPSLQNAGRPSGLLLRLGYSPLCHQLPERSLHLEGSPFAVCARCTGLYAGGVIGLLFGGLLLVGRPGGPRPAWLAWVVAANAVDAALPWIGLPGLPNLPRLLLALPAGFVAGLLLTRGIEDLLSSDRSDDVHRRRVSRAAAPGGS